MTVRTTVRLPEDLLANAKQKARAEGRTLTALIEDGLRLVVTERRRPDQSGRLLPRVSKATGGYKPGFEHMTASDLEELDDLEYIERMRKGFE